MSLVDTATGEVVQLSEAEARELTGRIRQTGAVMWAQIVKAYQGRAWAALGYSSWDAYTDAEFDGARIKLPREERREVVASLRDAGMSTRAIAAATGHDRNTIMSDLKVAETQPPAEPDPPPPHGIERPDIVEAEIVEVELPTITGTDGKTYPVKPKPAKPRAKPIVDQISAAASDLLKFSERIASIVEDERFARERNELAAPLRNQLVNAIESLQRLLAQLDPQEAEPT